MAEPVKARRLTDEEGQRLLRIVRRGRDRIRVRRATMILASASGTPVAAIARLVCADVETVREVIHAFNRVGLNALDPRWAGGRPRQIDDEQVAFLVATARRRPETFGLPFTRWSLRKLAGYAAGRYRAQGCWPARTVRVSPERLRQLLHGAGVSFQRTRTWKESPDPNKEAKLDRIEYVLEHFLDRCFAFDQFGPLSIRPHHGSNWALEKHPDRLPGTYRRTQGIRYFHGCYSIAQDTLWGVLRRRKGADHTLTAFKSIRAARPDGAPIYLICDNLSANKTPRIRAWCARNNVELCLTPTYASWADPIEAQFGPLRTFTMANSNYPNHPVLARELHKYLRWRNANARHPDVLAAQRRERTRIRSEHQHRWGRPTVKTAAA